MVMSLLLSWVNLSQKLHNMVTSPEGSHIVIASVSGSEGHANRIQADKAADSALWNALHHNELIAEAKERERIQRAELGRKLRERENIVLFGQKVAETLIKIFELEKIAYKYATVATKEGRLDFSKLKAAFAIIYYPANNSVALYDVVSGKPLFKINPEDWPTPPSSVELIQLLKRSLEKLPRSRTKTKGFDTTFWENALS